MNEVKKRGPHHARICDGRYVDLANIQSYPNIPIDNVAHSLAIQNRYNGQTRYPYSVAQHSWLVSYLVPEWLAYKALMHDAHESIASDLTQPTKEVFRMYQNDKHSIWDNWETMWERHFWNVFRCGADSIDKVGIKEADVLAASLEMTLLMPLDPNEWSRTTNYNLDHHRGALRNVIKSIGQDTFDHWYQEWSWDYARDRFLERYEELKP